MADAAPRTGLVLAAALAVAALAHAPALEGGFARDDHTLIEQNPLVREPRPLSDYFARSFWSTPAGPSVERYWRPLTLLTFAFDWRVWHGAARGFHATNLALHLACTALVFALARRAGAPVFAAGLGAAAFGALPRGSEPVVWISGRTDLLATAGALAALLLHSTDPRAHGRRVLAAAVLLAGLLAKEVALAGAAAIAVVEWRARGMDGVAGSARRAAPIGVALATYVALRASATHLPVTFDWLPPLERPLFAVQALGTYVAMLADALRPRLVIGRLGVVEPVYVAIGALATAALVALCARTWRHPMAPLTAALTVLALAALAPVLHLVPLPLSVVAADRFLYLPCAALAAWAPAAASLSLDARARVPAALACAALVVTFAVATRAREQVWKDELRLFAFEAEHAPPLSPDAHAELATVLAWRGRTADALAAYEEALRRDVAFVATRPEAPRDRGLRSNYALVLSEAGRMAEAVAMLEAVAREEPAAARHWLHLGAARARALDLDGATLDLERAQELAPDLALAAQLHAQVGRARSLLAGLPPEHEGEPLTTRIARARAYTLVGRLGDADRLWAGIAESPDVSVPDLVRAARHLVRNGRDLEAAERAIARLELVLGPSDETRALAGALAGRREPHAS